MSPDEIATAILSGLGDVIRQSLDAWWDNSGPVILGKAVSVMVGALVQWVWMTAGPFLGSVQFFTRIPPQWTVDLAPLAQFHDRARPLAAAALLLGLVLSLAWGGVCLVRGQPFGGLLSGAPVFVACTAALMFVRPFMGQWIHFANALSDSFFATGAGLPGFERMEAMDKLASTGIIGIIWLAFGLWFFVKRVLLIGLVIALYIAAPFALVAGAFPSEIGQRFFRWWLTTFVAATLVQVLQSGLLVVGGYMVAAPVVTGGAPSDAVQDLTTAGVGGAMILCAAWLPGFLLGGLLAGGVGGAGASSVWRMASLLASFGGAAAAGASAVHFVHAYQGGLGAGAAGAAAAGSPSYSGAYGMAGGSAPPQYASVHPVPPSGNVRSLLGGVPLLPPPQKALPSPR
jgi:hypothetical protein